MKDQNSNLLYAFCFGILISGVLIFSWYQHSTQISASTAPVSAVSTTPSFDQETSKELAAINPNCSKYYEDLGGGNNPISKELSDFTTLHPLSDFLCSKHSVIQPKVMLPDGKVLHFVAPVDLVNCGTSGHCTYYTLLEEKPGLVRHIRGFTWYSDSGSATSASPTEDADGSIFAWEISYDAKTQTLTADDSQLDCGIKNIYKFDTNDKPILISAYDSCLQGNDTLYPH
jgi:hypothetical protein